MDVAIPIVFPDYRISVPVGARKVDIFKGWTWDNFTTPDIETQWPGLGHAGVYFIDGKTGVTKYFEYGRYDKAGLGEAHNRSIPNVLVRDGKIVRDSLIAPLHRISTAAGHGGRIEGVYIEVNGGFAPMLKYAQLRVVENNNPKRKPYDILNHSCVHFTKDVVAAAGIGTPWMLDPRPNSYIGEFRDDYPDLDYNPRTRELTLELEEAAK